MQHQELVECVEQLLSETWQDLHEERSKSYPEFSKITTLRNEFREDVKLLSDLKFGTPIVAQIKKRIQEYEEQLEDAKIESPKLGSNF